MRVTTHAEACLRVNRSARTASTELNSSCVQIDLHTKHNSTRGLAVNKPRYYVHTLLEALHKGTLLLYALKESASFFESEHSL